MKKVFISAALSLLVIASSFATGKKSVNDKAVQNFAVEYRNAQNVAWETGDNYTKASFSLNDINYESYFDNEGNLVGTSSKITLNELPTAAKRVFAKKYGDYIVTEAIKFESDDEDAYYISANKGANAVVLKVSAEGTLTVFKTIKR